MKLKICTKCGESKELDCFHPRYDRQGGTRTVCKVCMSTSQNPSSFAHTWYKENFTPEELALFSKLKNLCTKAKLRTREFDTDVNWEYLFDIWDNQNGSCALSGLPLSIEVNDPQGVSLDRIDSSTGYVKGNLQLVSAMVNRMKQEFNEELFINVCGHITNHKDK